MKNRHLPRVAFTGAAVIIVLVGVCLGVVPVAAHGAVVSGAPTASKASTKEEGAGVSLEAAATKAGETGRKVAMSLIGLAFAMAAIVLAFRRNFAEAVGVCAIGFVSVLLATPVGVSLVKNTVTSLFGAQ